MFPCSAWGKHPLKSTEIGRFRFCQNITHYKSTPSFSQKIFITLRSRVQIPVSLHENQGLTLNRGSFVVFAWGFDVDKQNNAKDKGTIWYTWLMLAKLNSNNKIIIADRLGFYREENNPIFINIIYVWYYYYK